MDAELRSAGMSLFGTEDYESALSILPAYDGAVREFRRREKLIRQKYSEGKDECKNG